MPGNTASRRVLEKLGMRFIEGIEENNLQYFRIDAPVTTNKNNISAL